MKKKLLYNNKSGPKPEFGAPAFNPLVLWNSLLLSENIVKLIITEIVGI